MMNLEKIQIYNKHYTIKDGSFQRNRLVRSKEFAVKPHPKRIDID